MQSRRPRTRPRRSGSIAAILPLIVFLMQSVENFLCYGKRLTARRLGLGEVHDRPPALPPTPFGLASVERYAAHLGAYGAAVS